MSEAPRAAELPQDVVLIMRHLRRLARSRAFVRQVTVPRMSVDYDSGEVKVRRRKVRRRYAYRIGNGGGFLTVNDGPAAARDIGRLLNHPRSDLTRAA